MIYFVLFLISTSVAFAEGEFMIAREARAYYDAGDYDKAKELFEQLKQERLQPWQRARLDFNIGTIDLAKGDWDRAAQEYAEIPDPSEYSYFLNRALKTNLAILHYQSAIALLEQGSLSTEDYEKVLVRLFAALDNIEQAGVAECCLAVFLGKKRCGPAQELAALRQAVKRELALALKRYEQARIAASTPKRGLPLLLASVKSVLSHLDFLQTKPLDEKLSKNYRDLFIGGAKSWLPLWEVQFSQVKGLQEAYGEYQEGVDKMRQGNLVESRNSLLKAQAALNVLMQTLWGQDPIIVRLQNLLGSYERALNQVPIQLSAIRHIETEQNTLHVNNTLFDQSNRYLKTSLRFAKGAKRPQARFFLLQAAHAIRRLLRAKIEGEILPEDILEDGIEDQVHALTLARLAKMMDTQTQSMHTMLVDAQKQTLHTVAPFLSAVREKEINEYPLRCQCAPWNTVIPLFESGKEAAKKALELMEKQHPLLLAAKEQEQAVKFWKDALENLRHPKEQPPPPKDESEPKQEEPAAPEEKETLPIEEVLRRLQQMDQDDRRPKPSEAVPQEGLKPW